MPWSSDWWGDWYWDYHTWRWEWGGGDWKDASQPVHNTRPASSVNGAAAGSNAAPQHEDDKWVKPDVLEEADATYRIRTLKATPMECDAINDAFKDNEGARKYLTRVFKHWGKSEVYNDCKALLSMLATSQQFPVGEPAVPGTAAFALSKCMLESSRLNHAEGDGDCFCLPMVYVGGCRHNKPSLITPRKGLQDTMCHHCSKCIRCSGLPSCIPSLKCHPWFT